MTKKFLYLSVFITILIFSNNNAFAQTPVELNITHMLGGTQPYVNGNTTVNDLGNKFTMTRLEYYISKISITHDGGMVTDVPNHYILANGETPVKDSLGSFNITNVESISFYVGVDSPINNADPSLQPSGHPLAPKSPSMHWGWTSGYRFAAIEGKTGENMNEVYEVHSLGNEHYYQTTITVSSVNMGGKLIIPIYADYAQALRGIEVKPGFIDHGVPTTDIKVLNNFKEHVFKAGNPVSVLNNKNNSNSIDISPNPALNGDFTIHFNQHQSANIIIADLQGRVVKQLQKNIHTNSIDVNIATPGMYFVNTTFEDGTKSISKLLVQ